MQQLSQHPTNPQDLAFIGFKLPRPMADALRVVAKQRGTTQSALIRDALAKEMAHVARPDKKVTG